MCQLGVVDMKIGMTHSLDVEEVDNLYEAEVYLGPDKLILVLSFREIGVKHCEMDLETSKSIYLGWGCGREGLGGRLCLSCWGACVSCQWGWGSFLWVAKKQLWVTGSCPRKALLGGLICLLGVVWIGED